MKTPPPTYPPDAEPVQPAPAVTELRAAPLHGWMAIVAGVLALIVFSTVLIWQEDEHTLLFGSALTLFSATAVGIGILMIRRPPLAARRVGDRLELARLNVFREDGGVLPIEVANIVRVECRRQPGGGDHDGICVWTREEVKIPEAWWDVRQARHLIWEERDNPLLIVWPLAYWPEGGTQGTADVLQAMLPEVEVKAVRAW